MANDLTVESAARDAVKGISEAVRIMDLMGRGQDARNLDVYRNNLEAALRLKSELENDTANLKPELYEPGPISALQGIRAMLAGYDGQPNLLGDIFKIADAAMTRGTAPND